MLKGRRDKANVTWWYLLLVILLKDGFARVQVLHSDWRWYCRRIYCSEVSA